MLLFLLVQEAIQALTPLEGRTAFYKGMLLIEKIFASYNEFKG